MVSKASNERFGAICAEQISLARTYAGAVLQQDRAEAYNMFEGNRLGNEQVGRSQIVSMDLSDIIDATVAQLQPGFAGDNLAEFEQVSQDDAEQCKAESAAVNCLLVENNQGFYQLQSVIMDALQAANGTIKVWIEDEEVKERHRFELIDEAEVAYLQGTGLELIEEVEGVFTFETKVMEQKLRIRRVAPEDFFVDPNQDCLTYEKSSFVSERLLPTRSELIEMGYSAKVVDGLPAHTLDTQIDQQAKFVQGQQDPSSAGTTDRDVIEIFECYIRATEDGKTGLSTLWRVMYCYAANEVLEREPVSWIPYATGCPFLVPGRWYGRSMYHKLKDIVRAKSQILRQWIDGNEAAMNSRKYINSQLVNQDDLLTSRLNGVVRVKGNPYEAVMVEPITDVAQSAQQLLAYFDKLRAERCGASLDVMQPEAQVMKSISGVSAEVQLSSTEMMATMIARTLSETLIRNTYLLVHKTLREEWRSTIMIKLNGTYQDVDPGEWRARDRINVKVGVSPGERSKRVGALNQMLAYQMQLLQSGGANVMLTLNNVHRLLLDLGTAQGLDSIESYWIDPESPESLEAQQAMGQQSQMQAQQQQQAQAFAMQMQQFTMELEKGKVDIDRMRAENDIQDDMADNEFDRMKLAAEMEMKEAELVTKAIDTSRIAQAGGAAGEGRTDN